MKQVHIHISGEIASGKSTIATIIRKALEDKGIPNIIENSVGNFPTSDAAHLLTDDVEVIISEGPMRKHLREGK